MARANRLSPAKAWAWTLVVLALLGGGSAALAQSEPATDILSLEEAVERALEHAPGVAGARRSLERGALALESAEIAFKPRASASAGAAISDGDTGMRAGLSGSGSIAPGVTWSASLSRSDRTGVSVGNDFEPRPLSASLSVNWRLWPPGRDAENWRALETRRGELSAAEARLVQAERAAVVSVIGAYGRLAAARGRLALAEEALLAARREVELQKERRARGMASEADVIRAEIALLEQEGALSSRLQSVDSLTADLAELIGMSAARVGQMRLEPLALESGSWALPDQEAAFQRAVEASLAVAAQARALEAAKLALDVLRREGGPSVSVGGSVKAGEGGDVGWSVRIDGSYDLFDSGARANRIASAERDVRDAEIALDEALEAVRDEVASAYREIANAERSLAIASATLELRKREYEVGKEQVARGLISGRELELIERNALAAELDLDEARLAYNLAVMGLKTLLGLDP